MSTGIASPTVDMVAPTVGFPNAVPHTGIPHPTGVTTEVGAQVSGAMGSQIQGVVDAAVDALGTLSGVLLAGRAAIAATRVLARAAVRAAEEQRCLERQEELSALAAEQWEAAAYAVARANARRTALLARVARAAPGGSGEGPPRPDLPPPLDPVGCQLAEVRRELAHFEEAIRLAEEAQTAWQVRQLTAVRDEETEAEGSWQRMLRARQAAMVSRHMESREARAEATQVAPAEAPRPTADQARNAEAVAHLGAEILATLDPQATPKTVELAEAAVEHAVRQAAASPKRAQRHLGEARRFVYDANRAAGRLRVEEEWAAAQLDFLTQQAPEGAELLTEAPDAEKLLRKVLGSGKLLSTEERRLVELRVRARLDHLQALYVRQQCARVLTEITARFGGSADVAHPQGELLRLDWTPEGWGPDHWLRTTLADGTFRFTTMYREVPGERGPEDRALDDERCAEARQRLGEFTEIARELGLTLDFRVEQVEGARAGTLGEGAVVMDEETVRDATPDQEGRGTRHWPPPEPPTPKHRTVNGDDRP